MSNCERDCLPTSDTPETGVVIQNTKVCYVDQVKGSGMNTEQTIPQDDTAGMEEDGLLSAEIRSLRALIRRVEKRLRRKTN